MIIKILINVILSVLETEYEKINTSDVFAGIDPHDLAPMLGYKNTLPDDIHSIVKDVMDETVNCFDIRGGYRIFSDIEFIDSKQIIIIAGVDFSPHGAVYSKLRNSGQIAVFVCTAGEGIARLAKRMMTDNEPLKGFIADILGSLVVETAADIMQKKLSSEMSGKNMKITNRYSPGYCGWATEEQHKLFSLLPHGYCGVHLTESALMQPVKSVSGFIGTGKNVIYNAHTCTMCDAKYCAYRNRRF